MADPALDDLLQAGERPTEDEQHVRRVDLDELLVGVLAPALGRHRGDCPLEDLEQRLLDALARHVAGDRRVLALAGDLVDLVDVDDPRLGPLDVEVGGLDQLEEDVLDVLADVPRLGERRRVGDGKRDVEHTGERLGEVGLAAAGWAEEQDVRLLQLDIVATDADGLLVLDPPVVVVDRDGEDLLGVVLADDIVVEERADLTRVGQVVERQLRRFGELLLDDLVAEVDALVADVDAGAGDQLADLLLRLSAERALEQLPGVPELGHVPVLLTCSGRLTDRPGLVSDPPGLDDIVDDAIFPRLVRFHHEIAVGVGVDPLPRLAGVAGQHLLHRSRIRRISLAANSRSVTCP